jgi:hypothetical protein
MKEQLKAFSKLEFENTKALYESAGYKVITRWRKGCKSIRLADIVLAERKASRPDRAADSVPKPSEL